MLKDDQNKGAKRTKLIQISVVVPLYNEQENISELYRQINKVLQAVSRDFQIVFVDDGSTDGTFEKLKSIASTDKSVLVVSLAKNYGQTGALAAGFNFAEGEVIITMDGDLQHDPEEIPKFLANWMKASIL